MARLSTSTFTPSRPRLPTSATSDAIVASCTGSLWKNEVFFEAPKLVKVMSTRIPCRWAAAISAAPMSPLISFAPGLPVSIAPFDVLVTLNSATVESGVPARCAAIVSSISQ